MIVFAVAAVVVLSGLGTGTWFLLRSTRSPAPAASAASQAGAQPGHSSGVQGSPAAQTSPVAQASPEPDGLPTDGPAATSVVGTVTVAAAAAGNANAAGVAEFLNSYFGAINTHDYPAYVALLGPSAQGVTEAEFDSGYGSTADESEALDAISTADNGDAVAQVTFSSHQNAAESPSHTACTAWRISLYLVSDGGGYLIDRPPSGYHAHYAACG